MTSGRSSGPSGLSTVHLGNFWHKADWYRRELTDTAGKESVEKNKEGKLLKETVVLRRRETISSKFFRNFAKWWNARECIIVPLTLRQITL